MPESARLATAISRIRICATGGGNFHNQNLRDWRRQFSRIKNCATGNGDFPESESVRQATAISRIRICANGGGNFQNQNLREWRRRIIHRIRISATGDGDFTESESAQQVAAILQNQNLRDKISGSAANHLQNQNQRDRRWQVFYAANLKKP